MFWEICLTEKKKINATPWRREGWSTRENGRTAWSTDRHGWALKTFLMTIIILRGIKGQCHETLCWRFFLYQSFLEPRYLHFRNYNFFSLENLLKGPSMRIFAPSFLLHQSPSGWVTYNRKKTYFGTFGANFRIKGMLLRGVWHKIFYLSFFFMNQCPAGPWAIH